MADERPPADEARTKPDGQLRPKWWPKEGDETPGMDPRSEAHNPSSPPPPKDVVGEMMRDQLHIPTPTPEQAQRNRDPRNVTLEAKGGTYASHSGGQRLTITPRERLGLLTSMGTPTLLIQTMAGRWRYTPRADITALEVAHLLPVLAAGMVNASNLRDFDRMAPQLLRHFEREG